LARKRLWLALLLPALALCGCVAAVVGSGGGYSDGQGGQTAAARADAQLSGAVHARLAAEKGLPAGAISVAARDGMVTLHGHVATAVQRATAERVARTVPGVKVVVSELEVK
jgi:osmotically-inducible protein OsmY